MAKYRRRNTTAYSTYGSVAYAPAYDGSAVRAPRREEELQRAPAPYPKRRQQVRKQERARVQVRQAGTVAPFAVVGFLAVAVFAVMLITSYTQLTVANDEMSPCAGSCPACKARMPSSPPSTRRSSTWPPSRRWWGTPWSAPPTSRWCTSTCPPQTPSPSTRAAAGPPCSRALWTGWGISLAAS